MKGGTLKNNNAYSGGGVYVESKGVFVMEGGYISDNTASGSGYSYGGAVYVKGAFTMEGGTINRNTGSYNGGGIYLTGCAFIMANGNIVANTSNSGGGVYVNSGSFTMEGGAISYNTASYYSGGGVNVSGGTFTMEGGYISYNTAKNYGGGVYVDGGIFSKRSRAVIDDTNSAQRGKVAYTYSGSKQRNTTAGQGVVLNSNISGSSGGWE